MHHFVSPFASRNCAVKSSQTTFFPSAKALISALTLSLRSRTGSAASLPRGKTGSSSVVASGCFAAIRSSARRMPLTTLR